MLSRVLYWHKHYRLCSKIQAGSEISKVIPACFNPLIEADLRNYQTGRDAKLDSELLGCFEEHVLGLVQGNSHDSRLSK